MGLVTSDHESMAVVPGREVACRLLGPPLGVLERRGIPRVGLLKWMGVSEQELSAGGARMPWENLRVALQETGKVLSTAELLDLGRALVSESRLWRFRLAGGFFYTPRDVYRYLADPWSGIITRWLRCIGTSLVEHEAGELEIRLEMREGYQPSRELFLIAQGVFEAVPRVFGLGSASVQLSVSDGRACYVIQPSARRRILLRLRQLLSLPRAMVAALREFGEIHAELDGRRRELAETQYRLSEIQRDYQALQEQATDAIAIVDSRLRLLWSSARLSQMLGYTPGELVGMSYFDIQVPGESDANIADLRRLVAGERILVERRVRCKDGSIVPVEIAAIRLHDGRIQAILRDVSERWQLEEERRRYAETLQRDISRRTEELERANRQLRQLRVRQLQAERMGAAEDLSAAVAHVIHNPLTALIGTLQMDVEAADQVNPIIQRSLKLSRRIETVINRTLQLFRQGALNCAPADPAEILAAAHDDLAARSAERHIRLERKVERDLPQVFVDRDLLVAALISVAENAIDAQPAGGEIWLGAALVPGAGVVEFQIGDRGPGIPEEIREKVLEPFFTTKGGGTGLGLAIASNVVRGHAGRIRIQDRPGGGALISIEIPIG